MLADVIHKLAHEAAEDWANDALQFSAAEHLGRSFARENPEAATKLSKIAVSLAMPALTTKQKVIGGVSALGLAALEAHNTLGDIKRMQQYKQRRQALRQRRAQLQAQRSAAPPAPPAPPTPVGPKTAGKLPPVKGGDALLAGLTSLALGAVGKSKDKPQAPYPYRQPQHQKTAAELLKEALGLVGKGALAAGGIGTIYAGKKTVDHLQKKHQQFQSRPYRHGQAGAAHFRVARQM